MHGGTVALAVSSRFSLKVLIDCLIREDISPLEL